MLTYIYLIAITAEGMSGALAAGRRNMDIFGVSLIAFITALGGGTVRDILLGNFPIGWTQHPAYIYLTVGAGLFTVIIARFMQHLHRLFLVLDAMGLIAFTIIGCNVALHLNYSLTIVVIAGVTTGIFGGILRDIFCNRTPMVLRKELYACVSLLVALLYLGFRHFGLNHDINQLLSFLIGLSVRLAAIRWSWQLPVFTYMPGRWKGLAKGIGA
ncbi:trimeric intracellular cation channel family protein [Lonsdalea quercina]|uniref:trimeric intracellular cation channel family protein n=1 Tax=Lonsdalea quercina TaxID=71657 RepID=UPI003976B7DF